MNEREALAAAAAALARLAERDAWRPTTTESDDDRWQSAESEGLVALEAVRAALASAPAAPAPEYAGWYCAHCQRGVDGSEVTFHEQHQACGRVITDDRPPAAPTPQATAPAGALLQARAKDLHEKANMPWHEAERLALSEIGIDDAAVDELIGNSGGLDSMLCSADELRAFARSVLVHQPATPPSQAPAWVEADTGNPVSDAGVEARIYPLPDDLYPGSKDWLAADYAGRVDWLHTMYEAKKRALDAVLPGVEAAQQGNTGHGWVHKRPDGAVARCGGPALCKTCKAELAATSAKSHPQEGRMP
jgi:hypothetical protein